jgi:adenylate cyclase
VALLASAGFLGLHALATPGILLEHMTAGFSVAARVGLLLAAGFAAISALDTTAPVVHVLARHHRRVRAGLGLVLAAWAVATLARVPLLDRPLPPDAAPQPLGFLVLVGVALYGIAAFRYAELYRGRRRPLPLAVLVAFIVMAEAMIAVAFGRSWHATWWEWHVLMAVAFGAVVVTARVEYGRETAAFGGIYLESTLRRIVFQRWGDPDRTGSFGLHPCGGEVAASATFGGVTVPSEGRAGWFYGTERWAEGEFFRYQLTSVELLTRSAS